MATTTRDHVCAKWTRYGRWHIVCDVSISHCDVSISHWTRNTRVPKAKITLFFSLEANTKTQSWRQEMSTPTWPEYTNLTEIITVTIFNDLEIYQKSPKLKLEFLGEILFFGLRNFTFLLVIWFSYIIILYLRNRQGYKVCNGISLLRIIIFPSSTYADELRWIQLTIVTFYRQKPPGGHCHYKVYTMRVYGLSKWTLNK